MEEPVLPFRLLTALLASASPAVAITVTWDRANGGNGHTYHAVLVDGGITWDEAATAAGNLGPRAHLATITSAAENSVVYDLLAENPAFFIEGGIHGPWVGGRQEPGSNEPAEGWRWITGEPFKFVGWGGGEPNNTFFGPSPGFGGEIPFFTPENHLHLKTEGWNDLPGQARLAGFVAEVAPIPLPPASLVLVSALATLGGLSWLSRAAAR